MKILVANLGSTSFKYRLFDMTDERQLARGGTERIGAAESRSYVEIGGARREIVSSVPDHAVAVRRSLEQLTDRESGCLQDASDVAAIGFKAVHGGRYSGVQRVTSDVLAAMDEMSSAAPAHNPPYTAAMRLLSDKLPEIPLVAAFETGFHQSIPARNRHYAIPRDWADKAHVQRWGFHGASHRFISCHLGGSSSLCAIRGGKSMATSMGMSPQTGLPHNNRVGDFDPFALPAILRATGLTLDEILATLANRSGLAGVSGTSGDIRDIEAAIAEGSEAAQLALDMFHSATRHYLGAYLVELGGADVIVFTGGIGENGVNCRAAICQGLESLGIELDPQANQSARGEAPIHAAGSRTQLWIVPTNEEIVVARATKQLLQG
jgi:acetate kinase